ncbi:MAG: hypothetical protein A2Z34_11440 [Planctomycetes bacterium RBG_16_59_8]|nr:MAG: hypothetical protein A2Z34_11440 [Planctomycetes bacterium RBG_16_59_8]
MSECIFCKIVAGALPAEKIAEDSHSVAILDINPISPGHLLLLSRSHHETIAETPDDTLRSMGATLKLLATGVMKATASEGCNILQNNHACSGQAIPHIHFHVIPRKTGDAVRFNWQPKKYGQGETQKIARAIRDAVAACVPRK